MSPAQIASRLTNREASTLAMHAIAALQSTAGNAEETLATLAAAVQPIVQRVTPED